MAGSATVIASSEVPSYRPHAGMLRDPDVSATHIAFRYGDDLWLAPREGGRAVPLASPPGAESRPRFSPDGRILAFMGNYDGDVDIYTLAVEGGEPFRVTHHPFDQQLCDWTPDGRLLFHQSSSRGIASRRELFTVAATGGLPNRLPVPYGADGAFSPDRQWLAYSPNSTLYYATWKRYVGGTASDIWLFHLGDHRWRTITKWEGSDTTPMWHAETIYYLSDAGPAHRSNVWAFDTATDRHRQITRYAEFDVKQAAIGPGPHGGGEIILTVGNELVLLALAGETVRRIEVQIPGARPKLRPRLMDVSALLGEFSASPDATRVAVEARGDIWTLPAEHGTPRNLTRTSGVGERFPAWSPDGRWIAYFSDRSGEYELHIVPSDGKGEQRQLTSGSHTFYRDPVWSPDSAHIAFLEKTGDIWLHTLDSKQTRRIATDPWARDRNFLSWSPDSRWIAFDRASEPAEEIFSIWLYDLAAGKSYQVTSDFYDDRRPVFGRQGNYLYFRSQRSFEPSLSDIEFSFIHENTAVLVAVPLRAEIEPPYRAKSDEQTWAGDDQEVAATAGEDDATAKRIEVDFEGFEGRAFQLPVTPGGFGALAVNDKNQLIYLRTSARGAARGTAVHLFDVQDDARKERIIAQGIAAFDLTASGGKLVVRGEGGSGLAIHEARPDAKGEPVLTAGMLATIDPRQEWQQVFHDAWRLFRDYFYDPAMHQVDWASVRDRYAGLLEDCASRRDVSFLIGEMIAELSVSHARMGRAAPLDEMPEVAVGMLGIDYELDDGFFRITKIYEGAPWDLQGRNPLREAGVHEGEYLIAVNRVPVDTSKDPWASFLGVIAREVILTVSPRPGIGSEAREVVVTPRSARWEWDLRHRHWLEATRRHVAEKTEGRVGYVYIPDFMPAGLNSLVRQYFPQRGKEALIIDQRWNGGGWTPHRFLEILDRPPSMYQVRRDGKDRPVPPFAHFGPKCLLINELAGSSGDTFPWMFRQAGLGKLIGTRTWGGVVGLSGNPSLIDGQRVGVPDIGTYSLDGRWIIEGYGVDPDIEVREDPSQMLNGEDPQLDAAIAEMLRVIETDPYGAPTRPAGPDRRGMGIPEEDR